MCVNSTRTLRTNVNRRTIRYISRLVRRDVRLQRYRRNELIFNYFDRVRNSKRVQATITSIIICPLFFMTNRPNAQALTFTKVRIDMRCDRRASITIRRFVYLCIQVVCQGFLIFLRNSTVRTNDRPGCANFCATRFGMESRHFFVRARFPIFRLFHVMERIPQRRLRILTFRFTDRNASFFCFLANDQYVDLRRIIRRLMRVLTIFNRTFFRCVFDMVLRARRLHRFRTRISRLFRGLRIIRFVIIATLNIVDRMRHLSRFPLIAMFRGERMT